MSIKLTDEDKIFLKDNIALDLKEEFKELMVINCSDFSLEDGYFSACSDILIKYNKYLDDQIDVLTNTYFNEIVREDLIIEGMTILSVAKFIEENNIKSTDELFALRDKTLENLYSGLERVIEYSNNQ